jgi:ADP-ribosylglycohydrolase
LRTDHRCVVWASLAADALALGAHWIYDTQQIDAQIGRVDQLRTPLPSSFHTPKKRGDFTHYGDQTVLLLGFLAETGRFDGPLFSRRWQAYFKDYTGYRDHATKETLQGLEEGQPPEKAGSASSDLGGAARIAPLVYLYHEDQDVLAAAVRQQTILTHRNPDVVDSAAFFARVTAAVLTGQTPRQALQDVLQSHYNRSPFDRWVTRGIDSREMTTREAIRQFGQACDVADAFPGVVHLIAKYQDKPRIGLVENVMAGGDSAARGMIAGMIFGAFSGREAVEPDWVAGLNDRRQIESYLDRLSSTG